MGSGCQLGLRVVSAWAGRGVALWEVALDLRGKAGPARRERSKIRQSRQKHGPPTHHTVQSGTHSQAVGNFPRVQRGTHTFFF